MASFRTVLLAASIACAAAFGAAPAPASEPVDNCATVLGSLATELRIARALPPGRRTTYSCARRYTSLVGASRARLLRSPGAPDATGEDGAWSYFFAGKLSDREPGTPELQFRFDGDGQVAAVDCHRTG